MITLKACLGLDPPPSLKYGNLQHISIKVWYIESSQTQSSFNCVRFALCSIVLRMSRVFKVCKERRKAAQHKIKTMPISEEDEVESVKMEG